MISFTVAPNHSQIHRSESPSEAEREALRHFGPALVDPRGSLAASPNRSHSHRSKSLSEDEREALQHFGPALVDPRAFPIQGASLVLLIGRTMQ